MCPCKLVKRHNYFVFDRQEQNEVLTPLSDATEQDKDLMRSKQ